MLKTTGDIYVWNVHKEMLLKNKVKMIFIQRIFCSMATLGVTLKPHKNKTDSSSYIKIKNLHYSVGFSFLIIFFGPEKKSLHFFAFINLLYWYFSGYIIHSEFLA